MRRMAQWCLILLCPVLLRAGGFSVSPVRLDFGARQASGLIAVENPSGNRRTYQVTAVEWTQKNGEDEYREALGLVAVPPIFTLEAGRRQVVRLGVRLPAPRERAFRLFVQELPLQHMAAGDSQSIQTLLRISVPVFVAGTEPDPKVELAWRRGSPGGPACFQVRNQGAGHVHLQQLQLAGSPHAIGAFYILPGSDRKVCVPEQFAGEATRVKTVTDRGTFTYEVHPGPD
jgi:fimbrial chaperone protein